PTPSCTSPVSPTFPNTEPLGACAAVRGPGPPAAIVSPPRSVRAGLSWGRAEAVNRRRLHRPARAVLEEKGANDLGRRQVDLRAEGDAAGSRCRSARPDGAPGRGARLPPAGPAAGGQRSRACSPTACRHATGTRGSGYLRVLLAVQGLQGRPQTPAQHPSG